MADNNWHKLSERLPETGGFYVISLEGRFKNINYHHGLQLADFDDLLELWFDDSGEMIPTGLIEAWHDTPVFRGEG